MVISAIQNLSAIRNTENMKAKSISCSLQATKDLKTKSLLSKNINTVSFKGLSGSGSKKIDRSAAMRAALANVSPCVIVGVVAPAVAAFIAGLTIINKIEDKDNDSVVV